MDYKQLANSAFMHAQTFKLEGEFAKAAGLERYGNAIIALLDHIETVERELADCREKNAGLALALLTEQPPNPDCLGDPEWEAIKNNLSSVRDRAKAAEAKCEELDKIIREYQEELIPKYRAQAKEANAVSKDWCITKAMLQL